MVLRIWHDVWEKNAFRENRIRQKNPQVQNLIVLPPVKTTVLQGMVIERKRMRERERERVMDMSCHVSFSDAHQYLSISYTYPRSLEYDPFESISFADI